MTTTPYMELTKDAESGELYSVARVNANSDKIDAYCHANRERIVALEAKTNTDTMSASDEDNPTYGTETACAGIVLAAAVPGNANVGLQIFAGRSGETFMRAKDGSDWEAWIPQKQNALTFDTAPTASSTNPVTSGGIYSAFIGLTSIENGTDLDTLTAPGQYRTSSADATATLTHCPVSDQAIRLEVTYSSHVNRFIQRLYPANRDDGSFYVRKYLNGWGSWFRFAGQEVT